MDIVYLRSNPVNPDSRVEKQLSSLIKEGYKIKVLAWDREKTYKTRQEKLLIDDQEVPIFRVGIKSQYAGGFVKNLLPLLKFQVRIFTWLISNRGEIDIIHAADFDTGFTSTLANLFIKKKLVYDIFDYYVDSFSVPIVLKGSIEKLETFVINKSNLTIICTEDRLKQIRKSKPQELIVIHNSPPMIKEKVINKKNTIPKIVYVGVLVNGRMIEEITELALENKNFEFHIGGFGKLEEFLKNKSDDKNVFFHGKLTYIKTLELSSSADILIALYDPSIANHKYAAPNKFYEALMLGKPLIMAKNTGMSNVVKENNLGVLIDFNKKSLEKGIDFMILNYINDTSIKDKAHKIYNNYYSWDIMEKRLLKAYENIIKMDMSR